MVDQKPTFLDHLAIEMENLDYAEIIEPPNDSQTDEKFVGVLPEGNIRKLFHLWRMKEKKAKGLIVEAQYEGNQELGKEMMANAVELGVKANIIGEVFWASVKDEFNL